MKAKAKPISNPKPKYGEYVCKHCDSHIEGKFSEDDIIHCYICGELNMVKEMVKIAKPKEVKVKPIDSGITGTIISYNYTPGEEISNLAFNGVPYKGKKI